MATFPTIARKFINQRGFFEGFPSGQHVRWHPVLHRALTDEDLEQHCRGERTISVAAVNPQDISCRWGALDVDCKPSNDREQVMQYALTVAGRIRGTPLLERTGRGFHLWQFFKAPSCATATHDYLASLIEDRGEIHIGIRPSYNPQAVLGGLAMRLPGKHPLSGDWSAFWHAGQWLEWSAEALDYLDSFQGDEPIAPPSGVSVAIRSPWAKSAANEWAALHRMALRTTVADFQQHVLALLNRIGCADCLQHSQNFLLVRPIPLLPDDLFDWTVEWHNYVNRLQGMAELSPVAARQLWTESSSIKHTTSETAVVN